MKKYADNHPDKGGCLRIFIEKVYDIKINRQIGREDYIASA